MISVILIEPENAGNLGAIARAMANFGFKELVLINPKCDIMSKEAMDRAVHAKNIVKKAVVGDIDLLSKFDYLIATTAKLGTDYNIPRSHVTPRQLAETLARISTKSKIGIVIGRESTGMTNKEIRMCDFVCTITAFEKYPTFNISHALTILLYEIFTESGEKKIGTQIIPAGKTEKDAFFKELHQLLDEIEFSTKDKRETQKIVWQKLIGKSFLTKRELFSLFGFVRKLKKGRWKN
ncbi:MAG: RNA methyltransferase [Nanoarchaeota archaeon]|nr:RNA methyltransferase [Nanoarchaeota archaeon]